MEKILFILAGSAKQAENFARDNKIDRKNWVYVTDITRLLGRREGYLIQIGTWYMKDEYSPIYKLEAYCATHDIKIISNLKEMND